MNTYGLTEQDLLNARDKIAMQKKYLVDNELVTSNGQVKTLLDVSFSANHSTRYYAQLANKVNTIEQMAFNDHLEPIFMTITLDGFYRDLLKGDYTRFKALRSDKRQQAYDSVPNNERYGYIRLKMENEERLTIKDLYKILLFQNRQFRNGYAFKKLLKNGLKYHYIRTVEPHKDGVPHFHVLLYVPKDYIELFRKDFKRYFVSPRSQNDISFQTDIVKASAYIMKYITKTFLNVSSGNEIDYMQAWFIKHKIVRFVSSRSLIPQWVYKKCAIYEKDWYYLTDILSSPNNESEWSSEQDYFWIYDNWGKREINFFHGQLRVYNSDILVFKAGEVAPKNKYKSYFYEKVPKEWKSPPKLVPIYNEHNQIVKYYLNGVFYENRKHITDLSLFELQEYYNTFDIENDNYVKYLALRNLMIDKGLLNADKSDLSNFDLSGFLFG